METLQNVILKAIRKAETLYGKPSAMTVSQEVADAVVKFQAEQRKMPLAAA